MGEPHVVSGLVAKRAELAGEIEVAQRRLDQLCLDLAHVDAVLRLYRPDVALETIKPKRPRPLSGPDWFRRGELARLIFGVLREAETPPCGRDLALIIMRSKGYNTNDRALVGKFTARVNSALKRQREAGRVQAGPGPGMTLRWRLGGVMPAG